MTRLGARLLPKQTVRREPRRLPRAVYSVLDQMNHAALRSRVGVCVFHCHAIVKGTTKKNWQGICSAYTATLSESSPKMNDKWRRDCLSVEKKLLGALCPFPGYLSSRQERHFENFRTSFSCRFFPS